MVSGVLLLSGGVESVTLLHERRAEALRAVFIDYGQRSARAERDAAQWQCAAAGVELVALDMHAVGEAFRADQSQKWHVPLPHRNLVALSVGLSYATQMQARTLYLALNAEDTQAYPSASAAFVATFQQVARTLGEVALLTPFAALSKAQIITRGGRLGVDYRHTYSCLLGHARQCGRCPQCYKRRAAFAEAGVVEPPETYRRL
jgi:7-cyano-7-deazaguanine synthase